AAGAVLGFNARAPELLGTPGEELGEASAGRPIAALVHEDGSPADPSELPSALSMETGEAQDDVVLGIRLPGGVRWVVVSSAPLYRDDEQAPYATVTSFTDVTSFQQRLREVDLARLKDVKRLALVAEYRDDDTDSHTERVAYTASQLAMELGLERELIWTIGRAAPLHDVGKVGISDSILLKPGRLTPEEFDTMKTHTTIGGRILENGDSPVLQMGKEIALTHHERWDGSGYPAGLAGDLIPIVGRIVSMADAFDAMSHPRPYKAVLSIKDAVEEIADSSGSQFDPDVVEAFMRLDPHSLAERP
ncbi:MAG: HD domain-containing protein, partial [Acidobacteriota bacterium]|nr:HD domain-containing protein [Acidobacteriota bacterium]